MPLRLGSWSILFVHFSQQSLIFVSVHSVSQELFFHIFCQVFRCSLGKGNFSSCYSILAGSSRVSICLLEAVPSWSPCELGARPSSWFRSSVSSGVSWGCRPCRGKGAASPRNTTPMPSGGFSSPCGFLNRFTGSSRRMAISVPLEGDLAQSGQPGEEQDNMAVSKKVCLLFPRFFWKGPRWWVAVLLESFCPSWPGRCRRWRMDRRPTGSSLSWVGKKCVNRRL